MTKNRAWTELDDSTANAIWDRFYEVFSFKPGCYPSGWPGINEPHPSVTYFIANLYDEIRFNDLINDMQAKALDAFRQCIPLGEKMVVLDWQHATYLFDPHSEFTSEKLEDWQISFFPDGDYHIFLSQDLSFGTFGHPWEETICIFGKPLIDQFESNLPKAFQPVRKAK